jgi:hypothetical protein
MAFALVLSSWLNREQVDLELGVAGLVLPELMVCLR